MGLTDALRFRLRTLFRRGRLARDLDREMDFHLEMEAEHLRDVGVASAEARRLARVAFGGRQRFREATRDEVRTRWIEELIQDLRQALRAFRRAPAFALTVIATLAIGIGATTVIFSVADNIVIRSLPYANADRLVGVQIVSDRLANVTPTWAPNAARYLAWKQDCSLCEQVAALRAFGFTLTGAGDPTIVSAMRVSDNLFPMLGARAELGRLFAPGDDRPGNEPDVIISDALWRQQFGARGDIVGQRIDLNGAPWVVIGVLAPDFHIFSGTQLGGMLRLPQHTDAFIPLALTPRERATQGEHDYGVIVLGKRGVTTNALRAQLDAISAAHATALGDDTPSRSAVTPLRSQVVGAAGRPLLLLLAAVSAMLLIMCVNLASLFLARSLARRREAAVRVALGAGRGRLARQVLVETLLLSCIGGALGVVLARWGVRAFVATAPSDLPRLDQVHLDGRVLLAALVLSLFSGLACGVLPALRSSGTAPGDVLKDGSRATGSGRTATRTRATLIASQVGLSAMLLVAAGLFLKSFSRVVHADRGFTAERVLALNVTLTQRPSGNRLAPYEEAVRRVSALPGVSAVGLTSAMPLEGESWIESIWKPAQSGTERHELDANFRFVSPNYFSLLGVPLLAGRAFTEADRGVARVVLSENATRALWPGENPIGKLMRLGGDTLMYTVIGVVPNVRTTGVEHEGSITAYTPYWIRGYVSTILVRTSGDPASLTTSVREAIRAAVPTAAIYRARTMDDIVSGVVATRRFEAALITVFAATALLTACIGIYGIIGYALGRRAGEISLRMALGALPRQIHALVLREVFTSVAIGLAFGLGASLLLGRLISGLLFEVKPSDGSTFALVAATLAIVATGACWLPARRATRLDPVNALRAD